MIISEIVAAGIAAIVIACGGIFAMVIRKTVKQQTESLDLRLAAVEVAVSALHADGEVLRERVDKAHGRIGNLQRRRSDDRIAADANLSAVRDSLAERIDALSARIEAVEEASPSFSIIE